MRLVLSAVLLMAAWFVVSRSRPEARGWFSRRTATSFGSDFIALVATALLAFGTAFAAIGVADLMM